MTPLSRNANAQNIRAILGPTNTGKTHIAIERLCAHSSGIIGLPLRLLARELYDRLVEIKGVDNVALVTGEEKIVPPCAQWYLATVEAMPRDRDFAFVAIDEAQLAADRERGHIFTDRLLHYRGREETLIIGAASLAPILRGLIADIHIETRPRFSILRHAGPINLGRLPKRSAVVTFSVQKLYAIAELIRQKHGGVAIVMGALSPQTRNKQVALYQSGDVDYIVATDAIGMGLNLDIHHLAFAELSKFDGRQSRRLNIAEIAQIAGRAGRHQRDGSFGTLSGIGGHEQLNAQQVDQVENHEFPSLKYLYWRQSIHEADSLDELITALEKKPDDKRLRAAPEAIDLSILKLFACDDMIYGTIKSSQHVKKLWELARIPDFQKIGPYHHAQMLRTLWPSILRQDRKEMRQKVAHHVARLDRPSGDLDTLGARLSAARIWAFIAQKPQWVDDAGSVIEQSRALETRLSDAMHKELTQRFVDQRARKIIARIENKLPLRPIITKNGSVILDGMEVAQINGFKIALTKAPLSGQKGVIDLSIKKFLGGLMQDIANQLVKTDDNHFSIKANKQGSPTIYWHDNPVAALRKGHKITRPLIRSDAAIKELNEITQNQIHARIERWMSAMLAKHLSHVMHFESHSKNPDSVPALRAFYTHLADELGLAERISLQPLIAQLQKEDRAQARKTGLIFGALDIYHYLILKPNAMLWRTALFSAFHETPMPKLPSDNCVSFPEKDGINDIDGNKRLGFRQIEDIFIRIDMADRIIKQAHEARGEHNQFRIPSSLATSLGLSKNVHIKLLHLAGFSEASENKDKASCAPPLPALPAETTAPSKGAITSPPLPSQTDIKDKDNKDNNAAQATPILSTPAPISTKAEDNNETGTTDIETGVEKVADEFVGALWTWKGMGRASSPDKRHRKYQTDPDQGGKIKYKRRQGKSANGQPKAGFHSDKPSIQHQRKGTKKPQPTTPSAFEALADLQIQLKKKK